MTKSDNIAAAILISLILVLIGMIGGRTIEQQQHACEIAWTSTHTEADSLRVEIAGCWPTEDQTHE